MDTGVNARPTPDALLIAANRAAVYGTVSRWLIHELRSPVQAITLVTELLVQALSDVDMRTTLDRAAGHLTSSVELLDRVLRTRPRSSEAGPVSLPEVLKFVAAVQHARRSGIALDAGQALSTALPAVFAREHDLEHVLLNLIVNSMEALDDRGQGRITLGATAEDGVVTLVIEDDGPGIPSEVRARLFEPFATTKTGRATAGLGLAVARRLLSEVGGGIDYEPNEASGARFVVRLRTWRQRTGGA